jgi:DNA/RNA endonuclease YhcR with UshA esterase domain
MIALLISVLALVAPAQSAKPVQGPPIIAPEDAAKFVGKEVIVQGKVTQIVLSVNLTTHINLGGVYPNHVFTARAFKVNQPLFADVKEYDGKVVQVQGVVRLYRSKPEIVMTERSQIRLAE